MKKNIVIIIKSYCLAWLIAFLLVMSSAFQSTISVPDAFQNFVDLLAYSQFIVAIHVLCVILYFLFLTLFYFIRVYKKRGLDIMFKRLLLRVVMPFLIIIMGYNVTVYNNTNERFNYQWDYSIENKSSVSKDLYAKDGKHRGMSVFGWGRRGVTKPLDTLVTNNVEWVAVVPFTYQENETTKEMTMPRNFGQWSRRDSVFIKSINDIHDKNMHVMLKPHLWMSDGWRSNITLNSDAEWETWFASYRANMLHYAKMAKDFNVELLCIGTELKTSLKKQPKQWITLVKEIKEIYSGKLTYAANWDGEYDNIDFWNQLDYIGIQAYFPLTKIKNPDLEAIKNGWDRHITMLESLSEKHNKPILFTEIGYRSDASSTIKPWEWSEYTGVLTKKKSNETQLLAYEAMFSKLWSKDWFMGTYIWEWDTRTKPNSKSTDLNFSPRFKPAQNNIAKWYGKTDK
jgi:hypothetical protein